MAKGFCECTSKIFVDVYINTWSIVFGFLITLVIIYCGVFFNYTLLKKLKIGKRATPLGRKGNVIEPLMRWFLVIQIAYWPCELLFLWMFHNDIVQVDRVPTWLCFGLFNAMTTGRTFIAYNSFFVALIRYLYIVHHPKANQWNFEDVGRRFQVASVTLPVANVIVLMFTDDGFWLKQNNGFEECVSHYNDSKIGDSVKPDLVEWTLKYLPKPLVSALFYTAWTIVAVVYTNIIESFLYLKVFQTIKR